VRTDRTTDRFTLASPGQGVSFFTPRSTCPRFGLFRLCDHSRILPAHLKTAFCDKSVTLCSLKRHLPPVDAEAGNKSPKEWAVRTAIAGLRGEKGGPQCPAERVPQASEKLSAASTTEDRSHAKTFSFYWSSCHACTHRKSGLRSWEILIVVIFGHSRSDSNSHLQSFTRRRGKARCCRSFRRFGSQIELYKLQHMDKLPDLSPLEPLTTKRLFGRGQRGSDAFGPYMQSAPSNPINAPNVTDGDSALAASATDSRLSLTTTLARHRRSGAPAPTRRPSSE